MYLQFMFLHGGALLKNRFNILRLAFITNRPILLTSNQNLAQCDEILQKKLRFLQ